LISEDIEILSILQIVPELLEGTVSVWFLEDYLFWFTDNFHCYLLSRFLYNFFWNTSSNGI